MSCGRPRCFTAMVLVGVSALFTFSRVSIGIHQMTLLTPSSKVKSRHPASNRHKSYNAMEEIYLAHIPHTSQRGDAHYPKAHVVYANLTRLRPYIHMATIPSSGLKGGNCCYKSQDINLANHFQEAFQQEKDDGILGKPGSFWTEDLYERWLDYASNTTAGAALAHGATTSDCWATWNTLVLTGAARWDFPNNLLELLLWDEVRRFRYVEDVPGLPRVLLLGDSISAGIWFETQELFGFRNLANIHSAPNNGLSIESFQEKLASWLGTCPWDLVQLNIGMHYRPENHITTEDPAGLEDYRKGLRKIIRQIAEHSPSAEIVLALTTPSPFDTNATTPRREDCPNYDYLFGPGVVDSLNAIATRVGEEEGVTINDRYGAILPHLQHLQDYCDIHLFDEGYRFLGKHDWALISGLLGSRR